MTRTSTPRFKAWIVGIIVIMVSFLGTGIAAFAEEDPKMTGLPELTREDLDWQNDHMLRVKKVRLNKMGIERVNREHRKRGVQPLTDADITVVPTGKEVEGVIGAPEETAPSTAPLSAAPTALPTSVDNSTLKYFPPIRSQGSLPSCGPFSGTYYTMTHMHAMARNLDAKAGGDAFRFSPKWTYNMLNGGELVGSWYYSAWDIGLKHGGATWSEFPYDSNYRAWSTNSTVWRNAVDRRFNQYGYVANTNTDSGIEQVKQLLVNGYVLNFPTYITSWQWKTIGNDPATGNDDALAGKRVCYWVNGTAGYHAMTVVGYNDNIWVDVNGNGTVDSGEKGAFRIANSWGTGWEEAGFAWMAYDALKNPSAVSGGPVTGRQLGWSPARAHWITARSTYQPSLIAEFTLLHSRRNELRVTLGVSSVTATTPSQTWIPQMIYADGGAYAFNGTTTACDGTFMFDFSDIVPSGGDTMRYYLGVYDTVTGERVTIKDYRILDTTNGDTEVICSPMPMSGDNQQLYPYVTYNFNDGNIVPVAQAQATPVSGTAPLTVSFSAAGSYDPDGTIAAYEWDFGDGTTGSGVTVNHTYITSGNFEATLTVADNQTSANEDWLTIQVAANPLNVLFVKNIALSLQKSSRDVLAKAKVTILDAGNNPIANATVAGTWSGLVKGSATGKADAYGNVTLSSPKTRKSGVITFKVTNVSKSGFTYNAALNTETTDSISTSSPASASSFRP
ncbi:MAG: PKD domain-containing protein [Pseudomonadota bacterium]